MAGTDTNAPTEPTIHHTMTPADETTAGSTTVNPTSATIDSIATTTSVTTPPSSPEPDYTLEVASKDQPGGEGFGEDYRHDTTFLLDITAEPSQPGLIKGEQCPTDDMAGNSYAYLRANFPHWRRMLAHDYMRNTDADHENRRIGITTAPEIINPAQLVLLHIDDHAWASVDHYMQASKFVHRPDIYIKFTLDSNDPLASSPARQARRFGRTIVLEEEHIKAWEMRKPQALKRALLAKFAQNADLGRALVATGWAKLVTRGRTGTIKPQYALMWVRTVLRGEQVNQIKKSITLEGESNYQDNKHMDEIFRLIEGLFGKDLRLMAEPATATLNHPPLSLVSSSNEKPSSFSSCSSSPSLSNHQGLQMEDAMSYLEKIKSDYAEDPQTFDKFLGIMDDFRSERINTPQVLERVTLLFRGKPGLIRGFLMFLPPGHLLDISPENKPHLVYIATPTGNKIVIDTYEGTVKLDV
ncbi:Transcriptional regulatory protein sin3 [Apophysomyces ossiformis]|uniref:Transcriptional regulatory protein sin3 n=1 Tax=Apophysomyces ossiformis TaxID=679940 RepID=A0A8H7ETC5_9FUNG|nr:Transcriptional regulatory protein sin3 [Apophysomyces ossiformis]